MKRLLMVSVLCVAMAVAGRYPLVQAQTGDLKPKLATSIEEIADTYFTNSCVMRGCYARFGKDGTSRQALALDKLDSQPYAICSLEFKGTEMAVTEVSVSGVPSCGKTIGRYQVQLLEGGNIRIVLIDDPCGRGLDFPGEYKPVR